MPAMSIRSPGFRARLMRYGSRGRFSAARRWLPRSPARRTCQSMPGRLWPFARQHPQGPRNAATKMPPAEGVADSTGKARAFTLPRLAVDQAALRPSGSEAATCANEVRCPVAPN